MARRWRIRHKLMLGLTTAVGVLGLLVAVTLNGLWQGHVTLKTIECKLEEQKKAEVVKHEATQLKKVWLEFSKKSHLQFVPESHHPSATFATPGQGLAVMEKAAQKVDQALNDFDQEFKATLERQLTSDDGAPVGHQVEGLREQLKNLRKQFGRGRESLEKPQAHVTTDGNRMEGWLPAKVEAALESEITKLARTADDLQSEIFRGMNKQFPRQERRYQISVTVLICASILSVILMVSVLRYFYNWLYNPIRDLQQGVHRVAEANFDHRIEVHSSDEMEELAAAFNDMSYRLHELYRDLERQVNERSRQLVRSERLASVGFLAAGVAHEINNPLASIAFSSEALEARLGELEGPLTAVGRRVDVEIFSKYLRMIQEEANRCSKITERLLEHSRTGDRKREHVELAALIQSVVDVAQHHQSCIGNDVVFACEQPVTAWVNFDDVKSVVLNLVVNALESMTAGGRLTIRLGQRDGMAELTFTDTGCGMSEEILENVFEPFYTQSRSGKGTGLGLTIAHRIISQHGGEIEASSPGVDQGSTFLVRLPMQPAESLREESVAHAA